MKTSILFFTLILFFLGCSSGSSKFYATHADAVADDAIARGWVPGFLPQDATDIYERHSVDTGGVAVIFFAPNGGFLKEFSRLDHSSVAAAEGAFSLVHSPAKYPHGVSNYYYRCGDEGLGLLKTHDGNNFYYIEPVSSGGLEVLCKFRAGLSWGLDLPLLSRPSRSWVESVTREERRAQESRHQVQIIGFIKRSRPAWRYRSWAGSTVQST